MPTSVYVKSNETEASFQHIFKQVQIATLFCSYDVGPLHLKEDDAVYFLTYNIYIIMLKIY